MRERDHRTTEIADLIEFADRWASLGDAVTSQVSYIVDDLYSGDLDEDDINPAAIELAYERLAPLNDDIAAMLLDYLELVRR